MHVGSASVARALTAQSQGSYFGSTPIDYQLGIYFPLVYHTPMNTCLYSDDSVLKASFELDV